MENWQNRARHYYWLRGAPLAASGAKEFKPQPPSPNIPTDALVAPLRNNSHHIQ